MSKSTRSRMGSVRRFTPEEIARVPEDLPIVYEAVTEYIDVLFVGIAKRGEARKKLRALGKRKDLPDMEFFRFLPQATMAAARAVMKHHLEFHKNTIVR
jgi:hypothetical protein